MRIICCNWKMYGDLNLLKYYSDLKPNKDFMPVVMPPATLIGQARLLLSDNWQVGAQTCHSDNSGANTGCIAAYMLLEAGASCVLIGHSERRLYESESFIKSAYLTAESVGLQPILCVGELLNERANIYSVLASQLQLLEESKSDEIWVAYEPRWAIGTGNTPDAIELVDIFSWLRVKINQLSSRQELKIRLLYGGSLNSSNLNDFLELDGIDGGLVGGASLKVEQLRDIFRC